LPFYDSIHARHVFLFLCVFRIWIISWYCREIACKHPQLFWNLWNLSYEPSSDQMAYVLPCSHPTKFSFKSFWKFLRFCDCSHTIPKKFKSILEIHEEKKEVFRIWIKISRHILWTFTNVFRLFWNFGIGVDSIGRVGMAQWWSSSHLCQEVLG
jgi:hypothetical protein